MSDPIIDELLNPRSALSLSVMGQKKAYYKKVKQLFGSNLIGYWPLWESSGTIARDIVGGFNGIPTGANLTLGQTGIGDGKTAYKFGGLENYINPFSAGLASAWNGNEFSLSVWVQVDAEAWTDSALRRVLYIGGASGNYISIYKLNGVNNQFVAICYVNSTVKSAQLYNMARTDFFHIGINASQTNNRITFYWNGYAIGQTTFVAAFTPTSFRIGTQALTTPFSSHLGKIAHVVATNREATPSEFLKLATVSSKPKCISYIGDSITSAAISYKCGVTAGYGACTGYINHAVAGNSIMANMDTQVAAAASDNANVIFIALGANDNNAGDMEALQTKYGSNLDSLASSNPNAKIYCINVFPQWTDNTGATPVDKSNIRTAIAAVCTAKGVTCFDTFSTPWIAANETSDGLHPTEVGHAKIITQILAGL